MKERDWANLGLAFTLAVTAACTEIKADPPVITPDGQPARATATLAVAKPTETPTATETPDLFEGVVLAEGTGTLHKEGSGWIFDSPLTAEIGKNVPVVITEQKNVDGETQTWLGLKDHPNWPLFIQNEDGTWREAMKYVEVTEKFDPTANYPVDLWFGTTSAFVINGATVTSDLIPESYELYEFSPVIAGESYQDANGNTLGVFAFPLDGKTESPMVLFDMVIKPASVTDENLFGYALYSPDSPQHFSRVGSGGKYDLDKLLTENVGRQIALQGIGQFNKIPSMEGFENWPYLYQITVPLVLDNYKDTNRTLFSLLGGKFVDAHKNGHYTWGFLEIWMDVVL